MKTKLFLLSLLISGIFVFSNLSISFAQVVIDSDEYHQLKESGSLGSQTFLPYIVNENEIQMNPEVIQGFSSRNDNCDCYQQPDASYTLAMAPNDDGSSGLINLPFEFCFYGEQRTSLHINNNGNVSFAGPIAAFSANAFPSNGNVMVAPFWGDVDTRGIGEVWYKITPTAIYINWENVGYFSSQTDKTNTFQLILTDGTDPAIPDGGNIAFCYGEMQWTTGSASQGVNGFAGIPATVGANRGNNTDFFQIGRFDHPGNDYNGANIPSGISWLDDKTFYFNICSSTNVPPIASGVAACDTFKICALGDTADFNFTFLSPELDQITSLVFDNGGNDDFFVVNQEDGNTATILIRAIGAAANAGFHNVSITATDNGTPVGVTTINFVIEIDDSAVDLLNPQLTLPHESCDPIDVAVLNGPYDSYVWDDLTTFPTNTVSETGTFGVTVSLNGCYKRVEADFEIYDPAYFNLQGNPFVCPNSSEGTFMYIQDSLSLSSIDWGITDPALNEMFSNHLFEGSYTLSLIDTNGCVRDTVVEITTQPLIQLTNYDIYCMDSFELSGNTGPNFGYWSTINSPNGAVFGSNDINNVNLTVLEAGVYTLVYTEDNCLDSDTTTIQFVDPRPFGFDSDFHICPGETTEFLFLSDSTNYASISWGLLNPVLNAQYSNYLTPDTYTVTKIDDFGCESDTTFTITSQTAINLANYPLVCNDTLIMTSNNGVNTGGWSVEGNPNANINFVTNDVNTTVYINDYIGTLGLIYSEDVCNDADTTYVQFSRYPWTQIFDSLLCSGEIYVMEAIAGTQNTSYTWNTGESGPVISVTEEGTYIVTVENVCGIYSDEAFVQFIVCDLDVPNVFTPNGDGANDFFELKEFQGLADFSIVIFNRWGNVVQEYNAANFQWDGRDKSGTELGEGVYFYRVETVTINGREIERHGFVQLVRE